MLCGSLTIAVAQDANKNSKIKIHIEKEVDGKKQVIKKTFDDPNDPELQRLLNEQNMEINEPGNATANPQIFFKRDKQLKLNIDSDEEVNMEDLENQINELLQEMNIEGDIKITDPDNQVHMFRFDRDEPFDVEAFKESLPEGMRNFNLNFDFDADDAIDFFGGDFESKPMMGVTITDTEDGVEVTNLSEDLGAYEAGMQEGDIITEIDNNEIAEMDDIFNVLADKEIGDVVKVEYLRDGKKEKAKIELKEGRPMIKRFQRNLGGCMDSEGRLDWMEGNERFDNNNGSSPFEFFNRSNNNTRVMVIISDLDDEDVEWLDDYSNNSNLREMDDSEIDFIQFFPNPNNGQFNLKFEVNENADTQIRILNIDGRIVYDRELDGFSGVFDETVDIGDYGSGTYILEIIRNEGKMTKKIVVQ